MREELIAEEKLTEDYLANFPTKLRGALENPKYRKRFIATVSDEYSAVSPVYRAIHRKDIVDEDDFISNIEEAELYGRSPYRRESLELHAVSVNEDPQQIITALDIPNVGRPALGIAIGTMKKEYGPADFKDMKTHHNWYLFNEKKKILKDEFKVEDLLKFQMKEGDKNE